MNAHHPIRASGTVLAAPAGSMSPAEFVRLSRAVFAPPPPPPEYLAALDHIDDCFAASGNPLPGYADRRAERMHRDAMQSPERY